MEPSSGKTRPGKARAACEPCRSVKQRCDGATRYPCRRCELYGIECAYEGGAPPSTAVHRNPVSSSNSPGPVFVAPPALDPSGAPGMATAMLSMAASLRSITERLQHIETRMESEPNSRRISGTPSSSSPPVGNNASDEPDQFTPDDRALDIGDDTNPVQVVVEEMDKIDALAGEVGHQMGPSRVGVPTDALLRGLVTIADVELAFTFFLERIQPWIDVVACNATDRVPLSLRAKSPFLFHAILLVTNYYNTSKTERANEVYRGLTEILKILLAEAILCPNVEELNSDFVTALVLLIHYKPVQHMAFYSRGIYDLGRIVHASKVSPFSSMMLHALMHRTASFISLPNSPQVFIAAFASQAPVPPQVVSNLRLWLWLCFSDIHGSLQSGRPCQTDASAALRATRKFAELRTLPTDPRRAATLEGYAIARTPVDATQASKLRIADMGRVNDELDRWEQYWPAVLIDAQRSSDPLAYTAYTHFHFATLSMLSFVFTRWTGERRKSLAEGGTGRPVLSTLDWGAIQRAADACQRMIFSVSRESIQGGSPIRAGRWPGPNDAGYREPLTLDRRVVHDYTTGLDTVTCVSFVYALILLVKMASAGLIGSEIQALRHEYESGADLDVPQPLLSGHKLPRLLLLGSQFLKGISPQPDHPAYKHGILIEMILEAGLGAHTPHNSGPASPPNNVVPIPFAEQPDTSQAGAVALPPPSHSLGPSVESWLDALGPSAKRGGGGGGGGGGEVPAAPPGEAMRNLLDDMSTLQPASVPDGMSGEYFEGLDGMMVDWSAIARTWDERDA